MERPRTDGDALTAFKSHRFCNADIWEMNELPYESNDSASFTRLQPEESPTQQIGFGLAGIVLFALFGFVTYSVSQEVDGLSSYIALAASIVFFLLSAAALYGTVHVSLSTRVTAPILELESLELTRGTQVGARLVQKGPVSFNELRVTLVCTQTEFEEVSQETRRSFEDKSPYETETITLNRGEKELARIDLFSIDGLWAAREDEVVHSFTIRVPNDAIATGVTQISDFESYNYSWKLTVEADILGPNPKQEYEVIVV